MNLVKLIPFIILVNFLNACASNSGSNDDANAQKDIKVAEGNTFIIDPSNSVQRFTTEMQKKSALSKLTLNDITIDLKNNDKFKYTAFGITETEEKIYIYSHGIITNKKDILLTGEATYEGSIVIRPTNQQMSSDENVEYSHSPLALTVNFENRQIQGNFFYNGENINLYATINEEKGNVFSGSVNGLFTRGQFNGPHAEEMSGIITPDSNEKQIEGTFGAIKK